MNGSGDYSYADTVSRLACIHGFQPIGEGGFGAILSNDSSCVIKLIKDMSRCNELRREKEIYTVINHYQKDILQVFNGRIPELRLFAELDQFCHVNITKVSSPISSIGTVYSPSPPLTRSQPYHHGYVVADGTERGVLMTSNGPISIDDLSVKLLDRPGTLIHFYVNHFDTRLNEKLDQKQGILMGSDTLEDAFGRDAVKQFVFDVGQLMGFLIFVCHVIPTDVEVVLGTEGTDRRVRPFVLDFNEASLYQGTIPVEQIAGAIFYKNGKHYFPSAKNPYFSDFVQGMTSGAVLFDKSSERGDALPFNPCAY